MTTARAALAEFLGSTLLFATVIGSGILGQAAAGGNDGVALLGNTLATVAMLALLITTLGPVSGAHFNPAVSLVAALGEPDMRSRLPSYLAAQLAAAPAAVALAHAMFGRPLFEIATRARSSPGELLGELVATFMLLFTIHATLRAKSCAIVWTVPAAIAAGYWWTSSTSFANPAITIARAMTDSFSGIAPADVPGFIAAQLLGALAGWQVAIRLVPRPLTPGPCGC